MAEFRDCSLMIALMQNDCDCNAKLLKENLSYINKNLDKYLESEHYNFYLEDAVSTFFRCFSKVATLKDSLRMGVKVDI